jgi:hypothetical protein
VGGREGWEIYSGLEAVQGRAVVQREREKGKTASKSTAVRSTGSRTHTASTQSPLTNSRCFIIPTPSHDRPDSGAGKDVSGPWWGWRDKEWDISIYVGRGGRIRHLGEAPHGRLMERWCLFCRSAFEIHCTSLEFSRYCSGMSAGRREVCASFSCHVSSVCT